jgi:hypothetical protein
MQSLLREMMSCFHAKAYYPALITAVSIPDICGALESDGRAHSTKYIDWFNSNAARYFDTLLDGATAYSLRCSVVHQGRLSNPKFKHVCDEIMFVTGNNGISLHLIKIRRSRGKVFLVLELDKFCATIYKSTMDWLKQVEQTENYKNNYSKFFRKNIQPLPWDDNGVSIIAAFD